MKMKEFGPPGEGARPWCPLGSANATEMYSCLADEQHWIRPSLEEKKRQSPSAPPET